MKKIYLSFAFCLISILSFASGETVVVLTNIGDGIAETPTELKPVNPCMTLLFKVNINLPQGYVIVGKYEWFVNGVSVLTNTTDPGNPTLQWTIKSNPTSVYCKVTYQKQDGTSTSPSTSTTFTPIIKDLDFPPSISASTPPPNYGCASSTVSYNLPETICSSSFCDFTYNVLGNYNITWQAPAGWVQTSLTNKGSNVSFTPDATSAGTLTATIHLPGCTYTEIRTFAITRGTEAPIFFTSTVQGCSGSPSVMSINPVCGASDYTYRISGNPGVTFTSNGLQTLTSAGTSVNLLVTGGSSVNSISAKANFPGGFSSTENSATLNVNSGSPLISASYTDYSGSHPIKYWTGNSSSYNPVCNSYSDVINVSTQGASSTVWSKITSNPSFITWNPDLTGNGNLDFYFWSVNQTAVFEIDASNGCGTTSNVYGFISIDCSGGGGGCLQFTIAPNPASGTLNVVVPNIPAPCNPAPASITSSTKATSTSQHSITQINIFDNAGNLKKSQSVNNAKQVTVNLAGFKTGVYLVEISDGTYKERQQVIIQ